ncbi:N-acetyltransferase [Curtobacterium sp. MCPF17_031]|nr:N-acetyltransferase [Curtobacterium sp. MCPF17_031]
MAGSRTADGLERGPVSRLEARPTQPTRPAVPCLPDAVLPVDATTALTGFSLADGPALAAAVADLEMRRWLPLPRPYTVQLAGRWATESTESIRASGAGLVRCIRVGGSLAGCIDVKRVDWRACTAEIGYWLAPEFRGQGHASAAVRALSSWLLDVHSFERVELRIATGNSASARVASHAGFVREGVARNAGFTDDGRVDLAVWSRIAGEGRV